MLTDKDIDKTVSIVATKEDVRHINDRLDTIEEIQHKTLTALDHLASSQSDLGKEYAAMSEQLTRHNRWIKEIANHAKIKLVE